MTLQSRVVAMPELSKLTGLLVVPMNKTFGSAGAVVVVVVAVVLAAVVVVAEVSSPQAATTIANVSNSANTDQLVFSSVVIPCTSVHAAR
jgi:hypothetical protein